jgi:hypothetical protein
MAIGVHPIPGSLIDALGRSAGDRAKMLDNPAGYIINPGIDRR